MILRQSLQAISPSFFGRTRLADYAEIVHSTKDEDVTPDNLLSLLADGAHLPWVAGRPQSGHADGALSWLSDEAMATTKDTFTHLISLANHPIERQRRSGRLLNRMQEAVTGHWIDRQAEPEHRGGFLERCEAQRKHFASELLAGKLATGASVEVIYPSSQSHLPGVLSWRPAKLARGVQAGRNAMWAALDEPDMIQELPAPESRLQAIAQGARLVMGGAAAAPA